MFFKVFLLLLLDLADLDPAVPRNRFDKSYRDVAESLDNR
jgi:hypothetical protein